MNNHPQHWRTAYIVEVITHGKRVYVPIVSYSTEEGELLSPSQALERVRHNTSFTIAATLPATEDDDAPRGEYNHYSHAARAVALAAALDRYSETIPR